MPDDKNPDWLALAATRQHDHFEAIRRIITEEFSRLIDGTPAPPQNLQTSRNRIMRAVEEFPILDHVRECLTTAELEAELLKRRARQRPPLATRPDFNLLIEWIDDGMKAVEKTGRAPKDFAHHVFEAAVTAVYGSSSRIWPWYGDSLKGE